MSHANGTHEAPAVLMPEPTARAFHEAAHALIGDLLGFTVHAVTISPHLWEERGFAYATVSLRDDEPREPDAARLRQRLQVDLAGKIGEEFRDPSRNYRPGVTGWSAEDLEYLHVVDNPPSMAEMAMIHGHPIDEESGKASGPTDHEHMDDVLDRLLDLEPDANRATEINNAQEFAWRTLTVHAEELRALAEYLQVHYTIDYGEWSSTIAEIRATLGIGAQT